MERSRTMDYVYLATVCCVVSKQNPLLSLPTKWSVRCLSPANCSWVLTVILRMMRVLDLDSQWAIGRGQLCGHRHVNEEALMATDCEQCISVEMILVSINICVTGGRLQ